MGCAEKLPDRLDPPQGKRIASLRDRPAAVGVLEDQVEWDGAGSVMPMARRVEKEPETGLMERAVVGNVEGVRSREHSPFPS